jgi:hypothetical protein
MWLNSRVFILGGGPSMQNVDVQDLVGRPVIAVNNAFTLADWLPVMFFGDFNWYFLNNNKLKKFAGLKITSCQKFDNEPNIKCVGKRTTDGISQDSGVLFFNRSSGACAINLAVLFGAKEIVLLGFDMRVINGERNYHRDHEDWRKMKNPYTSFLGAFEPIARDLNNLNIKCFNATPNSAITNFPIQKNM